MQNRLMSTLTALFALLGDARAQPQVPEAGNFGTLTVQGDAGRSVACELRGLWIQAVVEGRFAKTTVEQTFFNPLPRQAEGTFDFRLPPGAAVQALALEIDGKWMEGEIVEREKARAVYDQIVREMRDPAILEWQGGERFKTQVFPIPPNALKRVRLAYLTRLDAAPGGREYRYSLPAMALGKESRLHFRFELLVRRADRVVTSPYDAKVLKSGADVLVSFEQQGFLPSGDLVARIASSEAGGPLQSTALFQGQRYFGLELVPTWPAAARSTPRDVVLLCDSSGSLRGAGWDQVRDAARQIALSLGKNDRLRLVTGDLGVRPASEFAAVGQAAALVDRLSALEPAGATDLEALLLAGAMKPQAGRRTVAIYLGDGQPSTGEMDGDLLIDRVSKAYLKAGAELAAVGLGLGPSGDFLRRLVRRTGGDYTANEPGRALLLRDFLGRLDEPLLSDVRFQSACAEAVLPDPIPNVPRGERIEVLGRLLGQSCPAALTGSLRGRPFQQALVLDAGLASEAPLLPVFWARERIAFLERAAGDRAEIVALSKAHAIVSRYTSLLVLENEEAYKRFQIERKNATPATPEVASEAASKAPLQKATVKAGESVADALRGAGDASLGAPAAAPAAQALPPSPAPVASSPDEAEASADREMVMAKEVREEAKLESAPRAEPRKAKKAAMLESKPRELSPEQALELARKNLQRDPGNASFQRDLIALLAGQNKADLAREEFLGFVRAASKDADRLLSLVPLLDLLPQDDWMQRARLDLFQTALALRPDDPGLLERLVDAMVRAGRERDGLALIQERRAMARGDTDALLRLIPAYGRLAHLEEARKDLLALSADLIRERPLDAGIRRAHFNELRKNGLQQEALRAIADWRRFAPDFPELVDEHAALLDELRRPADAERVRSELVEFNPHDFEARAAFAERQSRRERPVEACEEYTRAVQLNPGRRDTFRTMMGLRRTFPKQAEAIGRCIVDGVSRLPVIRDVSIVMLWEDPGADVDMHVIEPGGEEVWYQHLESAQGGHLYYDVTDGFGPEIYVVGTGRAGTYQLKVVYYRGDRPLSGRFIVIRHAGGPEETRKIYPFKLERANSDRSIPITSFSVER